MRAAGSASVFVDADDVSFEDLSIRNDAGIGDLVGQAVALSTGGDRLFFRRCHIFGNQDTIYTGGRRNSEGGPCRSYYLDCLIEGTTDFIFGQGTCVFENCEIRSKKNSYITAASTAEGDEYGYVFINCRLTAEPQADKVYLGRPWRDYAKVVWINCEMGGHIRPEGWHNWNRPEREKTAYYAEYGSSGPGSAPDSRVGWSHQLTAGQAEAYSLRRIMGAECFASPWNPLDNQ